MRIPHTLTLTATLLISPLWLTSAAAQPQRAAKTAANVLSSCAHPLQGAHCVKAYSLVSVAYVVIIGVLLATTLAILKPRFKADRAWRFTLLGAPLAVYLLSMLGFTLGGLTGLLSFPHDASPFFYMDWLQLSFVAGGAALYAAGALKLTNAR